MKNLVVGILVGFGLVGLAGYIFVVTGGMPVPVKSKPLPLEEWIASKSLLIATRAGFDLKPAVEPTEENLIKGAKIYAQNCAVCHGLPGKDYTAIASGLFPSPPDLLSEEQNVADFPVGGTYWIIKNGIRLTGMPQFESSLKDEELWQVAHFLKNAKKLSPAVSETLKSFR